jgi:hypothetical protein
MLKNLGGVLLLLSMALLIIVIGSHQAKHGITVRYDCRVLIGGWHPDVPVAVMEECKKRIKE